MWLRARIPAGAAGEFFSQELPQWHVKDPVHSAKSAGGRLHLNTHTSLTQRVDRVEDISGNEFTHISSGNAWPQSSQLDGLLTDPGVESGISVSELISTEKIRSSGRK